METWQVVPAGPAAERRPVDHGGIEIRRSRITLAQVREELDRFEERYGVPTERRLEVFDEDDWCFDEDLNRWSKLDLMWTLGQENRR